MVHKRVDMLGRMDVLNVLHADEHLLVVDKPAGLLAVPGRGAGGLLNLTSQLRDLHPEALATRTCRVTIVTRGTT